jgi:hypothetical protein
MPLYDRLCTHCGFIAIDVMEPVHVDAVSCPDCGNPTERAWLTAPAVVGDEMEHTQINGLREPRRFTSKQERKRWMKDNGYTERVRHIGLDGGDRSKHTTNWASISPETLENARIMLERTAREPAKNEPELEPLHVRTTYGNLGDDNWKDFHGR